jgi:hypothetical protein
VAFSSALGSAVASWVGAEPKAGSEYHVELKLGEPQRWTLAETDWVGVQQRDEGAIIQAHVESSEPDGYTVLRFGRSPRDPMLTVVVEGGRPAPGTLIRLRADRLSLYDENY